MRISRFGFGLHCQTLQPSLPVLQKGFRSLSITLHPSFAIGCYLNDYWHSEIWLWESYVCIYSQMPMEARGVVAPDVPVTDGGEACTSVLVVWEEESRHMTHGLRLYLVPLHEATRSPNFQRTGITANI
ncbi:hypothetical protein STEG23_015043, partial [Scotinomys teguina]